MEGDVGQDRTGVYGTPTLELVWGSLLGPGESCPTTPQPIFSEKMLAIFFLFSRTSDANSAMRHTGGDSLLKETT